MDESKAYCMYIHCVNCIIYVRTCVGPGTVVLSTEEVLLLFGGLDNLLAFLFPIFFTAGSQ